MYLLIMLSKCKTLAHSHTRAHTRSLLLAHALVVCPLILINKIKKEIANDYYDYVYLDFIKTNQCQ